MGTVFGKNTTSSSITVAGHKVYYIDSTDAEIVEVEGQGGGSTASDDATGTISGVTLPTAHSYTGVSFDSLRYYVKGTISNTGQASYAFGLWDTFFYGTITWEDSSLGDLTDKIATNSPSNNYRVKQTVFRIIFITYDSISGYHPWDDGDASAATNNNQISDYSYNNGVHSITFWADGVNWTGGSVYLGRIQFRYLDGVTTFNNLSAFDLVNVSGGSLSKATTTDRYNMYNVWNGDVTLHALYVSGQALPSVGDTVTFGNYPQATSTPEPIEWTVLAVDSVNGKALLIAKKVLDCQKYNSVSASVTWETCSLRTWLNSTFFNAAFDATEQGRIPLSHIETAGGNATDDNVFCMSDQEVTNTAYFADADARKALGTQKAIDAGVFTNENGYSVWWLRTAGSSFYFANYVYYDGGVQEYGVNATGFGVRPALWLNFASSVKYNAFKYSLSGTPYWYVIDGEHDTWTDDLSAWGYSEVQPVVELPTVILANAYVYSASDPSTMTIWSGSSFMAKDASGNSVSYDPSLLYKAYASYYDASAPIWFNNGWTPIESGGLLAIRLDTSSGSRTVHHVCYATCSDSSATVITVYNSSNVAYNAFKFTANNTDYYYVLDGTQTDWVSDLSSIGYSLTPATKRGYSYRSMSYYGDDYSYLTYTAGGSDYIPPDYSKRYVVVSINSSPSFDVSTIALTNNSSPGRLKATCSSPFNGNLWYVDYYEVDA